MSVYTFTNSSFKVLFRSLFNLIKCRLAYRSMLFSLLSLPPSLPLALLKLFLIFFSSNFDYFLYYLFTFSRKKNLFFPRLLHFLFFFLFLISFLMSKRSHFVGRLIACFKYLLKLICCKSEWKRKKKLFWYFIVIIVVHLQVFFKCVCWLLHLSFFFISMLYFI